MRTSGTAPEVEGEVAEEVAPVVEPVIETASDPQDIIKVIGLSLSFVILFIVTFPFSSLTVSQVIPSK